jgi:hypothetical protein
LTTLPVAQKIEQRRSPWPIVAGIIAVIAVVIAIAALVTFGNRSDNGGSTVQLGAELLDDFSAATINSSIWQYTGTYTATLDSPAASIQNGRVTFVADNPADEYYDGSLYHRTAKPLKLVSARVTLLDATGYCDLGLQANGLGGRPDTWAYIAMTPSDGTVNAFVGNTITGTEQTYVLLPGTGMPATHELALGWDGKQITFYVDGQARKSLPTTEMGHEIWLLYDVEPQGKVSGSFDDVRVTYAGQ